jgi:DNA-binding winged helix-turn-helix (wHTH) protein/Tol biopolymer transport system component
MPCYTFGPFSLDPEARVLLRDGEPTPMAGRTLDILVVLVQNRGRLVDKDELLSRVWAGTVVEEANLSQSIFTVRKILGDSPKEHRYIATVAGRGYQFVAPVTELAGETPQTAIAVPEAPREPASDSVVIGSLIKGHRKAAVGSVAVMAALAALAWFLLHRTTRPLAELTQKRLTFNSSENPVQSQAISPDGMYLAYSDPAGIHVRLLSTGDERLIPRPAWGPAGTYWLVDSWFPDGTQLLAHTDEPGGHESMWTVSMLGQSPRQLREGAIGFVVSPDGTHIAFARSPRPGSGESWGDWSPSLRGGQSDYIREIWVMGIQGDNPEKIVAVPQNEQVNRVRWSPDGQRLAYIRYQYSSDPLPQASFETCDLRGTSRTVVVPADPMLNDFCWLPEGRIVYARRDSLGPSDSNLWQIAIDNHAGTPSGKPKRITQSAGSWFSAVSASADGKRLAILKQTDRSQIYLSTLAAGGTRISPPRRLTNDEANDEPSAWTADSAAVLFLSERNGVGVSVS